ncbi:CfaE/CblD family pilus tip adhesin [Pandoraea anhela]|nr:CfaE/CblD family pilus tip adhesin [Pandoraea anhela]
MRAVRAFAVLAGIGAMGMASPVAAQSVPTDRHESVSLTFDRSSAPQQWNFRRQISAHYTAGNILGSRTWYACRSSTDTTLGACATRPSNVADPASSIVTLRFTENRSKLTVDLNITATKIVTVASSTCGHRITEFNSQRNFIACGGRPYDVSRYAFTINRAELRKIPIGGIWRGRLEFDIREYQSQAPSAVHSYDIELKVTDRQNAQIYFPRLSNPSPRVAFDLRARPGPGFQPLVFGGRTVDVCFYDGFGSNSSGALRVRASDVRGGNLPERPPGHASLVLRETNGMLPDQRIDYRVGFTYDGAHRWLNAGDPAASFTPVAQTAIRIVRLPGMPLPVACSPATLTFEIVPFILRSKVAGVYEGQIRIEMFVDAASI